MELFANRSIFTFSMGGTNAQCHISRWTADDIAKLKNMAQKEPCANLAAQLGRSVGATAVKAYELGISLKVPRQGGGDAEGPATD
jgi:hypothetical protein